MPYANGNDDGNDDDERINIYELPKRILLMDRRWKDE